VYPYIAMVRLLIRSEVMLEVESGSRSSFQHDHNFCETNINAAFHRGLFFAESITYCSKNNLEFNNIYEF
jgi:hypothetical protein